MITHTFLDVYYNDLSKVVVLSRSEEDQLFSEYYSSGVSQARKKDIHRQIVESNLRLVFLMAKRIWRDKDPSTLEELISNGNEGLLLAFSKFDHTRNIRFCTYAGHWIFMSMRKHSTSLVRVPQGRPIPVYVSDIVIPEESTEHPYFSSRQSADEKLALAEFLRFLTQRERFIVENSYGLNGGACCSLRELSTTLGLSSERIRQIKSEAVDKLSRWTKYYE
jgi:RNA polymerase sporulation-specific sigma factor